CRPPGRGASRGPPDRASLRAEAGRGCPARRRPARRAARPGSPGGGRSTSRAGARLLEGRMFRLTGSALDESDWPMMRADVAPHDHAVFVYDQEPDLLEPLEAFLHGGIKSREMTTFVHSFARHEKAQAFLARRVPDV